jgi:hypothetical protein
MKWTKRRLTPEESEELSKADLHVKPTVHVGYERSQREIEEDVRNFWRSGKWILYALAFIGVLALCAMLVPD